MKIRVTIIHEETVEIDLGDIRNAGFIDDFVEKVTRDGFDRGWSFSDIGQAEWAVSSVDWEEVTPATTKNRKRKGGF